MVKNYQEMLSGEHSGFIRHNGIRVVSVDEEKSVLTADVTPGRQPQSYFQGTARRSMQ